MDEKLGERIRRIRKERGLGLRATAREVGITAGYLSRIESGAEKYPPGEDVLRRLAEVLDDDFDELMRLAGRIPDEVKELFRDDPKLPEFLRTARARHLSGEDLLRLLDEKNRGGD